MKQNTAIKHKHGHFIGWFYDEVYRCTVHLIWPVNAKLVNRYLKRFSYAVPDRPFDGRALELGDDYPGLHLIALRQWDNSPRWQATLAHECAHLAEDVLMERGISHTMETREAWAYFQESVYRRCVEILQQPCRKKHRQISR